MPIFPHHSCQSLDAPTTTNPFPIRFRDAQSRRNSNRPKSVHPSVPHNQNEKKKSKTPVKTVATKQRIKEPKGELKSTAGANTYIGGRGPSAQGMSNQEATTRVCGEGEGEQRQRPEESIRRRRSWTGSWVGCRRRAKTERRRSSVGDSRA